MLEGAIQPPDEARRGQRFQSIDEPGCLGGCIDLDRDLPECAVLVAPHAAHLLEEEPLIRDDVEHPRQSAE